MKQQQPKKLCTQLIVLSQLIVNGRDSMIDNQTHCLASFLANDQPSQQCNCFRSMLRDRREAIEGGKVCSNK